MAIDVTGPQKKMSANAQEWNTTAMINPQSPVRKYSRRKKILPRVSS
jgi:hypothetical protein